MAKTSAVELLKAMMRMISLLNLLVNVTMQELSANRSKHLDHEIQLTVPADFPQ